MKYFIANWKARMDSEKTIAWTKEFVNKLSSEEKIINKLHNGEIRIIICPPFPFLYLMKDKIKNFKNIFLGTQDISAFDEGTYTGEVTAKMLQNVISYAIIGHSERRHYFNESEELVGKKITQTQLYRIKPILCLRGVQDKIYPAVKIITYEPVGAIWPGKNEEPKKVVEMKKKLSLPTQTIFIYGGSVDETNIASYLETKEIDGFLVGNASLNPIKFIQIVNAA